MICTYLKAFGGIKLLLLVIAIAIAIDQTDLVIVILYYSSVTTYISVSNHMYFNNN